MPPISAQVHRYFQFFERKSSEMRKYRFSGRACRSGAAGAKGPPAHRRRTGPPAAPGGLSAENGAAAKCCSSPAWACVSGPSGPVREADYFPSREVEQPPQPPQDPQDPPQEQELPPRRMFRIPRTRMAVTMAASTRQTSMAPGLSIGFPFLKRRGRAAPAPGVDGITCWPRPRRRGSGAPHRTCSCGTTCRACRPGRRRPPRSRR